MTGHSLLIIPVLHTQGPYHFGGRLDTENGELPMRSFYMWCCMSLLPIPLIRTQWQSRIMSKGSWEIAWLNIQQENGNSLAASSILTTPIATFASDFCWSRNARIEHRGSSMPSSQQWHCHFECSCCHFTYRAFKSLLIPVSFLSHLLYFRFDSLNHKKAS
jgi:hypothetical protein